MDAADYDALVLIHPEYEILSPDYRTNLKRRIGDFRTLGRPVLVLPSDIDDPRLNRDMQVVEICKGLLVIPEFSDVSFPERKQKEVDFITSAVGKRHEQIVLGAGGMYGYDCVWTYTTSWCLDVETGREPYDIRENPPDRPLRLARYLDDIVYY